MLRLFRKQGGKQKDDLELLQAYRSQNDLEQLGQLYERYIELVYGLCLKYFKNEATAEDAVMQIFEILVEKAKQHEVKNFKSWLFVLSKNYCLMQLRKENKKIVEFFDPSLMQSADKRHLHEKEDLSSGSEQDLKECMDLLNDQQKYCIKAFYFGDLSYKEIAEEQQLPVGKVRSFIQNGRRNLKICMENKQKQTDSLSIKTNQ